MLRRRHALYFALLVLSSFPALLFAYLGQHTRLIHDDFGVSAVGRAMGAWDGLVHYYNRWTSAYTSIFLKTGLAEHAVALPPLVTLTIIGIWLLSLYWLFRQIFSCLNLNEHRGFLALSASALVVGAAINAFYTPESFYWYSANMQYTVPLVCLIGCLALATWTLRYAEIKRRMIWGTATCALISFLTAGAAEMFLVFQLTFLTLLAALAWAVVDRPRRRALSFVAAAILTATAVGLIVQLSSPGIWNRMEADATNYRPPIRSLSQLALVTIQFTFESIGRQEVIAGFALLLGIGMLIGLRINTPKDLSARPFSAARMTQAAVFGLVVQLLFLPILWAHQSNNPQVLGRFSLSYAIVIVVNLALLLVFLLSVWQRRRMSMALEEQDRNLTLVSAALLAAFVFLVALTQARSIDARASTYLYVSALAMLGVLAILCQAGVLDGLARKLALVAIAVPIIAWITIAALVCATFVGHGFTSNRIMAGSAFLQVISGMFWGVYLGYLFKSCGASVSGRRSWEKLLSAGCLASAFVIGAGIFLGHLRLVPDLQTYAREWDARHKSIIALRESGKTQIEVTPLSFDLADYIGMGSLRSAEQFYQVESFVEIDA